MINRLLQENIQQFISQHENDDEQQLLLKHKTIFDVPASAVAWQISGRRKAKTKIPLYYNSANIVYPPGLNLEQSSSQETAEFKASILDREVEKKNTLVDLSGGFGIDSFFLSKVFKHISHIEPNSELLAYTEHNHTTLCADNVLYANTTAESFLKNHHEPVDCFFVDPSRRVSDNQKVYKLADCEPNIVQLLPEIFKLSNHVLIKTSPMLDLQQGISELSGVKHVWVVAVDNEVKELLFLCEKSFMKECSITAINLSKKHESFSFTFSEEKNLQADLSNPLPYLYEPNAAILKAGAFKAVANKFHLKKLHLSTHLYTNESLINDFPGRIFRVNAFIKADPKSVAEIFPSGKANVITRNYPLRPDELKKKLKLQDGGEQYLIGCSGEKEKFLIAAERLK
jgi:hypothetical protein